MEESKSEKDNAAGCMPDLPGSCGIIWGVLENSQEHLSEKLHRYTSVPRCYSMMFDLTSGRGAAR